MYPNDDQFEETTVAKVRDEGNGWTIERADGWSFYIPAPSWVPPEPGMEARFYGSGIGSTVRGLFLDGQKVFYRTEAEDKEKHEIDTYGADAAEWLKRWDSGYSVWSIEMGGIGPGYEQCIQITAAEVLRHLLDRQYDVAAWDSKDALERDHKEVETAGFSNKRISALGLSGSQWGAAQSLAISLYRRGPRSVMTDERLKDRRIQVARNFPASTTDPGMAASKALQDVATERQRQDAKWGGPEHDDLHSFADWHRFINERLACSAYANEARTRKLLIEIAALAVAAAESMDRKTAQGATP